MARDTEMEKNLKHAIGLFSFYGVVLVVVPAVIYGLLVIWDGGAVELQHFAVHGKSYEVAIYYIPGDATIQQAIQVRTVEWLQEDRPLATFIGYESLTGYTVVDDRTLKLILRDPRDLEGVALDTLSVKLP